jgi:hypothetical protein
VTLWTVTRTPLLLEDSGERLGIIK